MNNLHGNRSFTWMEKSGRPSCILTMGKTLVLEQFQYFVCY